MSGDDQHDGRRVKPSAASERPPPDTPAGGKDQAATETRTQRTLERMIEDHRFMPVIVKRNDEARRHPDDILQKAVEEGRRQHRRPAGCCCYRRWRRG